MEVTKLYDLQDMARIGCNDCRGCSACCQGMGDSVVLTPYDVHVLSAKLQMSVDALFKEWLQLTIVDGLLQPSMAMNGIGEQCHALDDRGRCSIHAFRPSICRLFPLGRYYEEEGFKYFLQTHECKKENRTKVKVKKWIDTPNLKQYESFVADWHNFLMKMEERVEGAEDAVAKQVSMFLLQTFYIKPYDRSVDFYPQYEERRAQAKLIFYA